MKENLFLIPVVYPEFKRTVENRIDLTDCSINSDVLAKFEDPMNVRVWGVKDSNLNRKFYKKMKEDDILLFYNSGDYIFEGRVGEKFQTREVSRRYWEDIPATLLYSIRDLDQIELPKEALNRACEYKENYQPQSLRSVDTQPLWKLEQKHGSVEEFLSEYK
mgnify:CR=1 FL=1